MKKQGIHLVFYDGECGFCDQSVQLLLKLDKHQLFLFAPLQGETAAQHLSHLPPEFRDVDSLILIEDFKSTQSKIYLQAKAVLRICWLLGGGWMLIGWLSFLPAVLFNWAYRLVARNRHRLFPQSCTIPSPDQKDRFLP